MKCPACSNELSKVVSDNIKVNLCKGGCGGLWFDQFELKKVDTPEKPAGETLAQMQKQEALHSTDRIKQRKCPRCLDIVMMRHYFSVKKGVLVDECAGCGGIWLDSGELEKIRNEFSSSEERDRITAQYFSKLFDPELAATKIKRAAKQNK